MYERQLRGVQELPAGSAFRGAVRRVPDDRVAQRRQVDTDLVRPTGPGLHLEQRVSRQRLDDLVAGRRRPAVRPDRELLAVGVVPGDRRVQLGLGFPGDPPDQGEVGLGDGPVLELLGQRGGDLGVLRDQEDAGRVLV